MTKLHALSLLIFLALLGFSCSQHPPARGWGGDEPPCPQCKKRGIPQFKVVENATWREVSPLYRAFLKRDSLRVGVFPFIQRETSETSSCDFCHAFSPDGVEFDFGSFQDSLLQALFPQIQFELVYPGVGLIPEKDSVLVSRWSDSLAGVQINARQTLLGWKPWQAGEQHLLEFHRTEIPLQTRELLGRIAARWNFDGLVIPAQIRVVMHPDAGEEGGFEYEIVWSWWDARQGEPLYLLSSHLWVETTTDIPADRFWSHPFLRGLSEDLKTLR